MPGRMENINKMKFHIEVTEFLIWLIAFRNKKHMCFQVCLLSAHAIAKMNFFQRKITLKEQFLVKGTLRDLFQFYLFYCRRRKFKQWFWG